MKKVYYFIILIVLVCVPFVGSAQKKSEVVPQRGPEEFPQLEFTNIPGAPQLSAPVLITGTELPVVAQGMGLAAPAFYDWDGDGLKDLLIGEFGTGVENSSMVGSFIRVYKNSGSESTPSFTGRWEYAKPNFIFNDRSGGTPFSVPQGCCIGTHPQFTDINCDGQADMVSGSYDGGVYVFYGTKEGFLPSEALRQAGDPYSRAPGWQSMQEYWLYSSASFGDLTGDGLPDLILGGTSLRISKNIGTAARPFFGTRDTLRLTDGNPLKVHEYTAAEMKAFEPYIKDFGMVPPAAGSNKICPYVVDWDGDGVLDILTTNEYTAEGLNTVDFFKGVKAGKDTRFLPAVTLFRAKDGGKAFPGSGPKIFVCDWNGDGVNDLLIGASVVTMNGAFNGRLSWNWEHNEGIFSAGKDPGNYSSFQPTNETLQRQREYYASKLPKGITIDEYMTIRHVGYVYVLLGKKR